MSTRLRVSGRGQARDRRLGRNLNPIGLSVSLRMAQRAPSSARMCSVESGISLFSLRVDMSTVTFCHTARAQPRWTMGRKGVIALAVCLLGLGLAAFVAADDPNHSEPAQVA